MSKTAIEWATDVWNPTRGCSRVSEGCRNCYAERVAARFSKSGDPFHGFARMTPEGPRWTGKVALVPEKLAEPLRWRKPRRIFVNSMSDLFHEALTDEAIDKVFAVMAFAPRHQFLVLTKRAKRMREYLNSRSKSIEHWEKASRERGRTLRYEDDQTGKAFGLVQFPLPNVWLGVSVEDQATADARIPLLLDTPAAVRFVSYEPALDWIDFDPFLHDSNCPRADRTDRDPDANDCICSEPREVSPDWIIVGGESGPGARPFDIAWARSTIAQCKAARVACFVKQLGAHPQPQRVGYHSKRLLNAHESEKPWTLEPLCIRDKKGGDMAEWPEDLRVREFPVGAT